MSKMDRHMIGLYVMIVPRNHITDLFFFETVWLLFFFREKKENKKASLIAHP